MVEVEISIFSGTTKYLCMDEDMKNRREAIYKKWKDSGYLDDVKKQTELTDRVSKLLCCQATQLLMPVERLKVLMGTTDKENDNN